MRLTNKDDFFDHENDNVESQEEKRRLEPENEDVNIVIFLILSESNLKCFTK